jgi:hypothetical protein
MQVQPPSTYDHVARDKRDHVGGYKHPKEETRTPERSQQTVYAGSSARPVSTPISSPPPQLSETNIRKKRSLHEIIVRSSTHAEQQQQQLQRARVPASEPAQLTAAPVQSTVQEKASAQHTAVKTAHQGASAAPNGTESLLACHTSPFPLPQQQVLQTPKV